MNLLWLHIPIKTVTLKDVKSTKGCISVCFVYLTLQKEEHQHADEIPVGTAPPTPFGQSFFCLRIVATEQSVGRKMFIFFKDS